MGGAGARGRRGGRKRQPGNARQGRASALSHHHLAVECDRVGRVRGLQLVRVPYQVVVVARDEELLGLSLLEQQQHLVPPHAVRSKGVRAVVRQSHLVVEDALPLARRRYVILEGRWRRCY